MQQSWKVSRMRRRGLCLPAFMSHCDWYYICWRYAHFCCKGSCQYILGSVIFVKKHSIKNDFSCSIVFVYLLKTYACKLFIAKKKINKIQLTNLGILVQRRTYPFNTHWLLKCLAKLNYFAVRLKSPFTSSVFKRRFCSSTDIQSRGLRVASTRRSIYRCWLHATQYIRKRKDLIECLVC